MMEWKNYTTAVHGNISDRTFLYSFLPSTSILYKYNSHFSATIIASTSLPSFSYTFNSNIFHGLYSFLNRHFPPISIAISFIHYSICSGEFLPEFWYYLGRWSCQHTWQRSTSHSFSRQSFWFWISIQEWISLRQHWYAAQACPWKFCRHRHCLLCMNE